MYVNANLYKIIAYNINYFIINKKNVITARLQVIAIFSEIKNLDVRNKSKKVAEIASQRNINISEEGVRLILIKWRSGKNPFYILIIIYRLLTNFYT